MPFGVEWGRCPGMGVLDVGGDRRREEAVLTVNVGHPIVTNGGISGVVIPCREGWQRGFSQITWEFLVRDTGREEPPAPIDSHCAVHGDNGPRLHSACVRCGLV